MAIIAGYVLCTPKPSSNGRSVLQRRTLCRSTPPKSPLTDSVKCINEITRCGFGSQLRQPLRFECSGSFKSSFFGAHEFSHATKARLFYTKDERPDFLVFASANAAEKQKLNVLVLGSGGREHALCKAIRRSQKCQELFCIPGNAGISEDATCVSDVSPTDSEAVSTFCKEKSVDLVVIGPEAPLVVGVADVLREDDVLVFGPSKRAAQLEGSKSFMKDFCARHQIPTAAYGKFKDSESAKSFIRKQGAPIVVKANGLAAGKGVIICKTEEEGFDAVDAMLVHKAFGSAGDEVVIEEFLEGEEASFFALVDGTTAVPFGSAQDHKAVGDGDTGPNTGGMGAYTPAPVVTAHIEAYTMENIIMPTVRGMAQEGNPFQGVLFAGLMIKNGVAKLLEFNIRFGDPECQPLCERIDSDLLHVLASCAAGRLSGTEVRLKNNTAVCVVMATRGYPGDYPKHTPIRGVHHAANMPNVTVYHAGTEAGPPGERGAYTSVGGRVLGVTALGATIAEAQATAYAAVDAIDWPDGFCRRDIGWRALEPRSS